MTVGSNLPLLWPWIPAMNNIVELSIFRVKVIQLHIIHLLSFGSFNSSASKVRTASLSACIIFSLLLLLNPSKVGIGIRNSSPSFRLQSFFKYALYLDVSPSLASTKNFVCFLKLKGLNQHKTRLRSKLTFYPVQF